MKQEPKAFDVLRFKGDWIFVRADWPDYYNEHGVTDVSCFQRRAPEESYTFVRDSELPLLKPFKATGRTEAALCCVHQDHRWQKAVHWRAGGHAGGCRVRPQFFRKVRPTISRGVLGTPEAPERTKRNER